MLRVAPLIILVLACTLLMACGGDVSDGTRLQPWLSDSIAYVLVPVPMIGAVIAGAFGIRRRLRERTSWIRGTVAKDVAVVKEVDHELRALPFTMVDDAGREIHVEPAGDLQPQRPINGPTDVFVRARITPESAGEGGYREPARLVARAPHTGEMIIQDESPDASMFWAWGRLLYPILLLAAVNGALFNQYWSLHGARAVPVKVAEAHEHTAQRYISKSMRTVKVTVIRVEHESLGTLTTEARGMGAGEGGEVLALSDGSRLLQLGRSPQMVQYEWVGGIGSLLFLIPMLPRGRARRQGLA